MKQFPSWIYFCQNESSLSPLRRCKRRELVIGISTESTPPSPSFLPFTVRHKHTCVILTNHNYKKKWYLNITISIDSPLSYTRPPLSIIPPPMLGNEDMWWSWSAEDRVRLPGNGGATTLNLTLYLLFHTTNYYRWNNLNNMQEGINSHLQMSNSKNVWSIVIFLTKKIIFGSHMEFEKC